MSGRIVKEKKKQEVWVVFQMDDDDGDIFNVIIDKAFDSERKAIEWAKANYSWEDAEGEEITDAVALGNIKKLVVE